MRKEMYGAFWWRKVKERHHLDGRDVRGTKMLKLIIRISWVGPD